MSSKLALHLWKAGISIASSRRVAAPASERGEQEASVLHPPSEVRVSRAPAGQAWVRGAPPEPPPPAVGPSAGGAASGARSRSPPCPRGHRPSARVPAAAVPAVSAFPSSPHGQDLSPLSYPAAPDAPARPSPPLAAVPLRPRPGHAPSRWDVGLSTTEAAERALGPPSRRSDWLQGIGPPLPAVCRGALAGSGRRGAGGERCAAVMTEGT